MEKHLERIREEYRNYRLDESEATEKQLNNYMQSALTLSQNNSLFLNALLRENGKFDENYEELQKRVQEGFCWDMGKVFEALEENASLELFRLGFFMTQKFASNIFNIYLSGFHFLFEDAKMMPNIDDGSLFTEVFFIEKFKEITGRDLVAENRGKVYGKK